jgi:lipoprotein-anchoring transpeptidase ErfK/SrfK
MKCNKSMKIIWSVIIFAVLSMPAIAAEDRPVVIDSQQAALQQKAIEQKTAGDLLGSRATYQQILAQYPQAANTKDIQRQIWDLNVAVIFSSLQTHQTELYMVEPGDTLKKIAQKFGTTIELIKRRNHLETSRIKAGDELSVWLGSFRILIDKSDNTLTLFNGEETVKVYPVSTGKNASSPTGNFMIKDRFTDPVWFHKGDVVPANDPKNYLGTRWLGFDLPKYGIHGTIEPELIGQSVSSGCIRMRNADVQELYEMIPMGTSVSIVE